MNPFIRIIFGCCVFCFLLLENGYAYLGETISPDVIKSVETALPSAQGHTTDVDSEAAIAMANTDSRWKFKPGLGFTSAFDSNVNREESSERDEDIIFETTPSLRIERQGGIIGISAGYLLNYQRFVRSRQANIFNQDADIELKADFSRFRITTRESFRRRKSFASSEQTERRSFNVNDIKTEMVYDISSRVSGAFLHQNSVFRYGDSTMKENSYLNNRYALRGYYHLTKTLDLFVDGGYRETLYYRANGFKNSQAFFTGVGLKGSLSPRAVINATTGFNHREYRKKDFSDDDNWYAEGSFKYRMTQRIDGTLLIKRDLQEALSATAVRYRATRVGLNFKYQLSSFVALNIGSFIQRNNFHNDDTIAGRKAGDRTDNLVGANAGIEWEPWEHFFVSAQYEMDMRHSNASSVTGYTDHMFTTGVAYRI